MKNITSSIGWVLLAVVLIVPAFLFYNWWTDKKNIQMADNMSVGGGSVGDVFKKENQNLSAAKIKSSGISSPSISAPQIVVAEDIRKSDSQGNNAYQKQAVATDVSLGVSAPISSADKFAVQDGTDSIAPLKSVSKKSDIMNKSDEKNVPSKYAQNKSTQPPKASYFEPKSDRDPTISPLEYARIKEDRANMLELERMRRLEEARKNSQNSVKNKLEFQGVIGNNVIINGEMYSVGDTVMGARIIKVGSNYFIASHKGKRFKKILK